MSKHNGFDRRSFLKGAGMTALAAAGARSTISLADEAPMSGGMFNFDEVYDRSDTDCVKWDAQYTKYGRENIKVGMGIADMDFRAAPCIKAALLERCQHENWGYTVPRRSYLEAIAEWNRVRHGVEVDPDSIVLSSGVHPGLIAALNTVAQPGTKVLLMTPTYNGFYGDLRWSRTLANESRMINDNGVWSVDWDDFESRLTPDTRAILLCNPQNPTGNCWSQEDLLRIGRLCLENQVTVLADEIHCDFVMNGQQYTPFASLPDEDVVYNSLTFKAISKTFSLAAMKSAYWYSTNPALAQRVKYNHRVDLNTLGMVANEAAYRDGAEWFDQLRGYIDGNHEFVESYLKKNVPGVTYRKAQGTYLAWLDMSGAMDAIDAHGKSEASQSDDRPLRPSDVMEQWLVANAGVQLNAGGNYGLGGEHFMRMNLGAPRPLIRMALDGIAEAIDRV